MSIYSKYGKLLRLIKRIQPATVDQLSEKLDIEKSIVREELDFLINAGKIEELSEIGYIAIDDMDEYSHKQVKVGQVMNIVRTFDENTILKPALIAKILDPSDCLIVTKDGKLCGLITPEYILKKILNSPEILNQSLASSMLKMPNILYVTKDDLVAYAVKLLLQHNVGHLPVVESNKESDENYLRVVGSFNRDVVVKLYSEVIDFKIHN